MSEQMEQPARPPSFRPAGGALGLHGDVLLDRREEDGAHVPQGFGDVRCDVDGDPVDGYPLRVGLVAVQRRYRYVFEVVG